MNTSTNIQYILDIGGKALMLVLYLSAPAVLAALVVGLIISILQATTQIQEQSLTFVPKLVGVFIVLILFGSALLNEIQSFAFDLLSQFHQAIH